jgi:hypothetical protein
VRSDFWSVPFSVPGVVRHLTPYRGEGSGTLNNCASVPSVPVSSGTLAHSTESYGYEARHRFSVPPVFSVPPMRTPTSVRHTEKRPDFQFYSGGRQ